MQKIKKYIKTNSRWLSFLVSFGVCLLSVVVVSFLASLIASFSSDPTAVIGISALASLLVSAVVSGIVAVKIKKDAGALYLLAVGLATVIIMLIICLIFEGGGIGASTLMNYVCYLGAFILSSLLAKRGGSKRRRFHRH